MQRKLTGGPGDGRLVESDATMLQIQELPSFDVYHAIDRISPIRPDMKVAVLDGRIGIYELRPDGSYLWAGWQDAAAG